MHAPEGQLVALVDAHGSELVRLVPALASRLPDLPPSKATDTDTERFLLFAAVVGVLVELSRQQPVVLVLDDLQWADKASLQLLRHLVAAEQPMRLLVLGTYRDSELSRSHPFLETLAALRRLQGVVRAELTGLDDTGVISLMEAAAGQTLDDAAIGLAHAVYRETDGNPFFVGEVLRHLTETGAIAQDANGRWVAQDSLDGTALPDSVREVIGARVGRLGEDAERVLSVAAVIGRDFDLDVLARATMASEDDLLDILDAAIAAALVREVADTGRYNFAHALIQRTLYEDLGPNRRARAHRQVGEALEALCGDRPGARVGELARHWFSATKPIDLAKAIDYSRQAGDAALSALAPADALRYYSQALELYGQEDRDPTLGLDLAIGLGTAQRQAGDPAFRDTLVGAARRAAALGDTQRFVAAALANDRGFLTAIGAIDTDKVEILKMALDRLATDDPDRALVLASLCAELAHGSPLDQRQALAGEAIAIAETYGDEAVIVRVLNNVAVPLFVPPLLDQSLARTADALARAERLGDPALLFWASTWRGLIVAQAGYIDESDRCTEVMGSLAERLDQPLLHWCHLFSRCLRAQIAGDTDQAEQLATEALQLGTDNGIADASVQFGAQFITISTQRGTVGDLALVIEQMGANTPDLAPALLVGVLAMAHAEADRTDAARLILEQFAASGFDLPLDQLWLTGMAEYAAAAIACRDPQYAAPLFDHLAPYASLLATASGATASCPVSYYLGGLATVLGRYQPADAYFTQAAAFNEGVDAKFFAARTNLLWGNMLAERGAAGDIERARAVLTNAHKGAAANGYATVERRAAAALQHLD